MTHLALVPVPPVAHLDGVSQHYGKTVALNNITLDIPARCMVGLIGPDGVGKSSLLSLISGARVIEHGNVMVLGGDMRDPKHRRDVCPRIAWMPHRICVFRRPSALWQASRSSHRKRLKPAMSG